MIPYYETPSTTPSNLSSGTVDKYVRLRMEYYLASPLFDCCLIPQVNLSLANQVNLSPRDVSAAIFREYSSDRKENFDKFLKGTETGHVCINRRIITLIIFRLSFSVFKKGSRRKYNEK